MKVLPEPLIFEWDKGNADKNLKRHRVSQRDAETIFFDEQAILLEDPGHSLIETRYAYLATSENGRKLTIIFTIRQDKIRIISARDMSRKERRIYEKSKKNPKI